MAVGTEQNIHFLNCLIVKLLHENHFLCLCSLYKSLKGHYPHLTDGKTGMVGGIGSDLPELIRRAR